MKPKLVWIAGLMGGALVTFLKFRVLQRASKMNLNNQVALITGSSRGLGFILAREYVKRGANVVLCARSKDQLVKAQNELQSFNSSGSEILIYPCDVSSESNVSEMIQFVVQKFGKLDILVNNAGIIQVGPVETMTKKDFSESMNINLFGSVHTILSSLPFMKEGGRIINITSIGGAVAVPHLLPYTASKFAFVGLSLGLRSELRKKGIQVLTVLPGLMRTGSFVNAFFKGKHKAELNWFSLGASLPIISMDAERAALKIVQASYYERAFLTLGLPAQLARIIYSIIPGISANLAGSINRLLPSAPSQISELKPGKEIKPINQQSKLKQLGTKAAFRFNEV